MKWIMVIIGLILLAGCALDDAATVESKIELTPYLVESSANVGDDIELKILVDECTEPIFGLCLQLEYNEEYLYYDNQSEIVTGEIFSDNSLVFVQSENGIVHISMTLQQDEELVANTGMLCQLTFNCENAGITQFNIIQSEINAYDEDGNLIECEYQVSQAAELEIN